jgi:8-oxo-dGTP diphosphatase
MALTRGKRALPASLAHERMNITRVAAAVITKADGTFLLAQRPEGKPYPGYWEFPGGKIETGETAHHALVRELKEELDITVTQASAWLTRVHTYTHATVHLTFFRVTNWLGEPRGLEGQAHGWQSIHGLTVAPMLPANTPIFRALALPSRMVVSAIQQNAAWLTGAEARLRQDSCCLVQLREKRWLGDTRAILSAGTTLLDALATRNHAHPAGALVLNSDMVGDATADLAILWRRGVGLHMTSAALMQAQSRPDFLRADAFWGASCHRRLELEHAAGLGVDYAVLGPVSSTASHPGDAGVGWQRFADLAQDLPMPIFAIGGLGATDVVTAREHGAHGVAAISEGLRL